MRGCAEGQKGNIWAKNLEPSLVPIEVVNTFVYSWRTTIFLVLATNHSNEMVCFYFHTQLSSSCWSCFDVLVSQKSKLKVDVLDRSQMWDICKENTILTQCARRTNTDMNACVLNVLAVGAVNVGDSLYLRIFPNESGTRFYWAAADLKQRPASHLSTLTTSSLSKCYEI